ncbi:hypothetical protein D3C76_1194080 [compost metagenome]
MYHSAVGDRDILTRNSFFGILSSCLDRNAVITDINIAIANSHIGARLWINAICIRRVGRVQNGNIINSHIVTAYRINGPAWRIDQRDIFKGYPLTAVQAD